MKRFSLVLILGIILSTVAFAQTKKDVKFLKVTHDFGTIKESIGSVTTSFEFINQGKFPIVIQGVKASCGCTTPSYTREPVLPNKKGVVTASYSTIGRPGNFNKTLTVYTNTPDTVYILTIKGTVIADVKR